MSRENILGAVQDQYGRVARSSLSNDQMAIRAVAQAFGYTPEELESLPPEANMGLSCGNPVALAALQEGEVVLDLGCGGGLDVFLAAKRVGPTGRAIGIDMTPEMLARAQAGAARAGVTNVEFHEATIDQLPLADASVDCVISNCVINLAPDKSAVFREILRVLKPGGRVALSDIALKKSLPDEVRASVQAYVGCIAGALHVHEYTQLLRAAGFSAVVVQDMGADLNAYAQVASTSCCAPSCCESIPTDPSKTDSSLHADLADVLARIDANAYAASVRVHAVKPVAKSEAASDSIADNSETQPAGLPVAAPKGVCCGGTGCC